MYCDDVKCTSTFTENQTANLLFPNNQVRKVRIKHIFEVNDNEIYL